jgi:hypothetical protein
MERFEDGDVGSVIKRKDATMPPATRQAGLEIPATLREHLAYHDSNIVAESGVNPYALGDTAAGTQYAAEVNAIQGAAGLTAGVIQKAHTSHWERTVSKFLAVCKQYDDMPIHLRYDDVKLQFDASDPIRGYLEPDARVTVREDSLSFAPKAQGIAMAKDELAVAQGMAQQFPMAVQQAYEQYLTATGKKNTQKWLEQPEMNSLPGPDHGAAAAQERGVDQIEALAALKRRKALLKKTQSTTRKKILIQTTSRSNLKNQHYAKRKLQRSVPANRL